VHVGAGAVIDAGVEIGQELRAEIGGCDELVLIEVPIADVPVPILVGVALHLDRQPEVVGPVGLDSTVVECVQDAIAVRILRQTRERERKVQEQHGREDAPIHCCPCSLLLRSRKPTISLLPRHSTTIAAIVRRAAEEIENAAPDPTETSGLAGVNVQSAVTS
jgi:hypothetical protein